jgi:hypothetical protein
MLKQLGHEAISQSKGDDSANQRNGRWINLKNSIDCFSIPNQLSAWGTSGMTFCLSLYFPEPPPFSIISSTQESAAETVGKPMVLVSSRRA